jgi:hypothetical protein
MIGWHIVLGPVMRQHIPVGAHGTWHMVEETTSW